MLLYKALYFFKLIDYKAALLIDKAIINRQLRNYTPRVIDKTSIKTILLARNDGIGDMVITTPMIRALAQNGYKVSVISQKSCLEIIENNPYVSETFIWKDNYTQKQLSQLEQELQSRHFDLVIDMRYPIYFKRNPHRTIQSYYFGGKYSIGWNKSALKCFDASINHYTRREHYITLVNKFLEFLDIRGADLRYEFFINPRSQQNAQIFMDSLRMQSPDAAKVIVLNPFTGHHRRDMSLEQIRHTVEMILTQYPGSKIVAIGLKERVQELINTLKIEGLIFYNSKSIMDVVPLIERADLVISPDTSIIHLVGAFQKPLVGLYASGRRTPPSLSNAKIRIKEKYHEQVDEARAYFFDEPNIRKGLRPKGKMLLVENSFGPNNPNAIQLKNYTHCLSEIPAQDIFNAVKKLLSHPVNASSIKTL